MISLTDYYMGRDKEYPAELTDELKWNASSTVDRVNQLLEAFGQARGVRSGWRPAAINKKVPNAAPQSKHMTCQACDINDSDGALDAWCLAHPEALERIGLWMEDPEATPTWCHVQIVPPKSGKRVFVP